MKQKITTSISWDGMGVFSIIVYNCSCGAKMWDDSWILLREFWVMRIIGWYWDYRLGFSWTTPVWSWKKSVSPQKIGSGGKNKLGLIGDFFSPIAHSLWDQERWEPPQQKLPESDFATENCHAWWNLWYPIEDINLHLAWPMTCYLLVGGLEHEFYDFPFSWE